MKHLNYQEFIEAVKEHIGKEVQKKVSVQPVLKNNGTTYDGLIIIDPTLNISPTIYLNPYYHRYLEGVSMEDIYEDILHTYYDNLPKDDFDVSIFCDYNKAKERIIMKLINADKNKDLLKKIPHILVYDLAIVFMCSIGDYEQEFSSILIHNHHLSLWNITEKDLYELAMENTPRLLPSRLDNLHDVFAHITDESLPFLEELEISILTNHLRIHGATCMLYPNLLQQVADIFEDDVIIIPSSIHEVLVYPKRNLSIDYSLEDLNGMIQEVNETQLLDEEVLSDHIYFYNRDTKEITFT